MIRRRLFASAIASAAAILILAAGCAEQTPTAVTLEPTSVQAGKAGIGKTISVLKSSHQAGTFSAVITPAGGTIDFGIGSITFPAGAVSRATAVSATVNGADLAVEFQPHGTTFPAGHEPTLTFNAGAPGSIYYVDKAGRVLEALRTRFDGSGIHAELGHFSHYATARD